MRTLCVLILALLSASASAQDGSDLMADGAYSATVKAGLAPGETRIYRLSGERGQQLTARLVSQEDNGYLVLTDSEGQPLLFDPPNSTQVRNLDLILPRSGEYTLEVAASEGSCSYLLEVTLDQPAAPPE